MRKEFISGLMGSAMVFNLFGFSSAVQAEGITITGNPCYGHTITAEGAAGDVKWYVSESMNGKYVEVGEGSQYTIDVSSIGRWIKAVSGDISSEPIKDITPVTQVYTESFDGKASLGSEWTVPESGVSLSNNCLMGWRTDNTASLTLPNKVSGFSDANEYIGDDGLLVYDMNFSYQNSKGVNITLSQGSGTALQMIIGQDNSGNDRILVTNTAQSAHETVISSNGDNPGDGKYHNIRLLIDLRSTSDRDTLVSYDNVTSAIKTGYGRRAGYGQAEFKKVDFKFNAGKPEPLYIDSLNIYKIKTYSAEAPYAANVTVEKNINSISADYDFIDDQGDAEGSTKYEWYSSDRPDGDFSVIPSATGRTLTDLIHENRYVKARITPVDEKGNEGVPRSSEPVLWNQGVTTYINEDFSDGEFDTEHFLNTNGVEIEDGHIIATAAQGNDLLLHINDTGISSGKAVVEMKVNQISGTDGFDFTVCGSSPSNNRGTYMGVLYSNQLYATAGEAEQVGTLKSYVSNLDNGSWHTIKYYVDLDEKTTELMVDGAQVDYCGQYFTNKLQNLQFTFKDDVTVAVDDIKVYTITGNAEITGECKVGESLEGCYEGHGEVYSYAWLISDTSDGEYEYIDEADGTVLLVEEEFEGKYIKFEVTLSSDEVITSDYVRTFVIDNSYVDLAEDTVCGAVEAENHSGAEHTFEIILASYNSDGALVNVVTRTVVVSDKTDSLKFTTDPIEKNDNEIYKVYVWDSLTGLRPL